MPASIQQVPEGFLLRDHQTYSVLVGQLIAIVVWNATLWTFVFWQLAFSGFLLKTPSLIILWIILGLIELFTIYTSIRGMYRAIDQVLIGFNILPGELIFTSYPLSLGEEASVIYRRRLRAGKAIRKPGTFNAILSCEEEVEYKVGTDTAKATETVLTRKVPEVLIPAYDLGVDIIFKFKIPINGPPSFSASSNRIKWKIRVDIDLPRLVKDSREYMLEVQPEVKND